MLGKMSAKDNTLKNMHIVPIQIRFNDVDQMGHINNAVIMEYFDLGKSLYFAEAGVPVRTEEGDFAVMIVHYEVDFLKQLHYTDDLFVTTRVERFGYKSLTLEQCVMCSNEPCVRCRTVMSGYQRSLSSAVPIPEELKEQLRQFDASR